MRKRSLRRDGSGSASDTSWLAVFLGFATIGSTAFGGGSATVVAMRKMCIERGWLTAEEFLDTVVLSRLTPGITILAEVLLIGKKVCGKRGMVAGLAGMLLPAVLITIVLCKIYVGVSSSSAAATPLRCVIGAAAGFSLALTVQLSTDALKQNTGLRGLLIFAAYLAIGLIVRDPLIVIVIAIAAGVLMPNLFRGRDGADEP